MKKLSAISLILFDLGGVLVELGDSPVPNDWLPESAPQFSIRQWFQSDSAQRFESGEIDAQVFAENLQKELELSASTQDIILSFTQWPKGLYPEAICLLEQLSEFRLAVLSNSNELHWPQLSQQLGLQAHMEKMLSSHLLGAAKPSIDAFNTALDKLQVLPHEVLFYDDNPENIKAASKLGIHAYQVNGPKQVLTHLKKHGLLTQSAINI